MIFENEITKRYRLKVGRTQSPQPSWYCESLRGDGGITTHNGISPQECIIKFLDNEICLLNLTLDSERRLHQKKCSLCKFFKYQYCTNEEKINQLRENFGIIPPLKVDPDYCCDKFEVE